jgi:hypothetical protein
MWLTDNDKMKKNTYHRVQEIIDIPVSEQPLAVMEVEY